MDAAVVNAHFTGNARIAYLQGREYLVAPLSLINPGVLPGSQGALYYPPSEIKRNPAVWNGTPITVYHPFANGDHVSAKHPGILEKQGIGFIRNSGATDKLRSEGWFDVQKTKQVDKRVYDALVKNTPMEISTGLYTENIPAPVGATDPKGRPYVAVATNYKPDHVAMLPDQIGACILPGQEIQGRVRKVSKARYTGEAVRIRTAHGSSLAVTPNHPILTCEGFVPAGQLTKGQNLLHYVGEKKARPDKTNEKNIPALVEDVFRTFAGFLPVKKAVRRRASAFDFHGDAAFFQGDVEIISAQSALGGDGVAETSQRFAQGGFSRRSGAQAPLSRSRHAEQFIRSMDPAHIGAVGCRSEALALSGIQSGVHKARCRGSITDDPFFSQPSVNNPPVYSESMAGLVSGLATEISSDHLLPEFFGEPVSVDTLFPAFRVFGPGAELDVSLPKLVTNGVGVGPGIGGHVPNRLAGKVIAHQTVNRIFRDESLTDDTAPASNQCATGNEHFSDSRHAQAALFRELLERFAGKIITDQIVGIDRFFHDGPIYDFESPLGYILAQKLIVSNCSINDGCGLNVNARELVHNPFKSEAQRRYLWAKEPDIAEAWAHGEHTADKGHKMPEEEGEDVHHAKGKKKAENQECDDDEVIHPIARKIAAKNCANGRATMNFWHKLGELLGISANAIPPRDQAGRMGSIGYAGMETPASALERGHTEEEEEENPALTHVPRQPREPVQKPARNALGPGNWNLETRKAHADGMTERANKLTEQAEDNTSHRLAKLAHDDAAEAHWDAYKEASSPAATKSVPDYAQAGFHHQQAKYHEAKAEEHRQQMGEEYGGEQMSRTTNSMASPNTEALGNPHGIEAGSPHEMSKNAAHMSMNLEHPPAIGHATKALMHSGKGNPDKAAAAHASAAEAHEQAAMEHYKNKEVDNANMHMNAAGMHRNAAAMHSATCNQRVEVPMTSDQKRATLAANCKCEKDRVALNQLSDEVLELLVVNEAKATGSNAGRIADSKTASRQKVKEKEEDGAYTGGGGGKTLEEDPIADDDEDEGKCEEGMGFTGNRQVPDWLKNDPVYQAGAAALRREQTAIVNRLTQHIADAAVRQAKAKKLMSYTRNQLHELLELLPPQPAMNRQQDAPLANYVGAAGAFEPVLSTNTGPDDDADDTSMVTPTLNFAEIAAENSGRKMRVS